jgi:glycosyltransferase involved in cell wall biosynthesis
MLIPYKSTGFLAYKQIQNLCYICVLSSIITMLSILIPEYNVDCTLLVARLGEQCRKANLVYEILVMDDASIHYLEKNRTIATQQNCKFIEIAENQGSAKTRNALIRNASYEILLLLDCDLEVMDDAFIQNYLDNLDKAAVLAGSVVYQNQKPEKSRVLRWKYGVKRESRPAAYRNRNPWSSLSTVNVCMHRSVFDWVTFDEGISDYGHEDTLFGIALKRCGISVLHLDNPLIHNGLDEGVAFLEKSLKATAKYLSAPFNRDVELQQEIRIFRVFNRIRKWKLVSILAFQFSVFEPVVRKQLLSNAPSLFLFDCYRLGYLCKLFRENAQE